MAESLAGLFKEIADAIRVKKNTSGKIPATSFVDEILTIGRPASLDYEYDGTLTSMLSNIADAIRLKRGISGNIQAKDFADEIYKIPIDVQLDAPSIYMYVDEDSDLPDSSEEYVHFSIYTDKMKLLDPPPVNTPVSTASLELHFGAYDAYHVPETVTVTGATGVWAQESAILGKLVLTNLTTDVTIIIAGVQYKLQAPQVALYSTVTFVNYDGTQLKVEDVKHGDTPRYIGRTPVKAGDGSFDYYVFVGWSPALKPVDDEITYTAVFEGTNNETGTITWKDYDGEVLEVDTDVPRGVTPTFDDEEPRKPSDRLYTYTFSGWEPQVVPVTGDAVYTAQYSSVRNVQTFENEAGGLTYVILSKGYTTTDNAAGGKTYAVGDVE